MSVDHKAIAEQFAPQIGQGLLPNFIAAAQAHATIALVEEMRTANIIAALNLYAGNNGQTLPEIQARLGWPVNGSNDDPR